MELVGFLYSSLYPSQNQIQLPWALCLQTLAIYVTSSESVTIFQIRIKQVASQVDIRKQTEKPTAASSRQ